MGSFKSHDTGLVPVSEGFLESEDGHEVYWACHGNPRGTTVLLIHGGPGSGTAGDLISLFDLSQFFVVVCDQRGAGRSRPFGALNANGPDDLVNDMERLRVALQIETWMVVGGSWGSTVALRYAQQYPKRVERMVLWGVWLFRSEDIEWHIYGARSALPEAWEIFATAASYRSGDDLLECFAKKVFDERPNVHGPAAAAWKNFERQRRAPTTWRTAERLPVSAVTTNMSRIMLHYFRNYGRTGDVDILGNISAMSGIPGKIVHGRNDLITPFTGALELTDAWPQGELITYGGEGHTIDQEDIRAAVMRSIAA